MLAELWNSINTNLGSNLLFFIVGVGLYVKRDGSEITHITFLGFEILDHRRIKRRIKRIRRKKND